MTVIIFVLALLCALLAYLLIGENKKISKLIAENSALNSRLETLKEISDIAVADSKEVVLEDNDARQKPLDIASVRTALRFNGITPNVPEMDEPNIVYFNVDNTSYRINATHLPFLAIEAGFKLEESKDNLSTLHQSAVEVTSRMFIGKVEIGGNGDALYLSAEFLCDSYTYLRNNLKGYLHVLRDAQARFFQTLDSLKQRQKEELEAVLSGHCFIQDSTPNCKVQS